MDWEKICIPNWETIPIHNHPEQVLYRNGIYAVFVNKYEYYLLKNHKEKYSGTLTHMENMKKVLQDWEKEIIYIELKL